MRYAQGGGLTDERQAFREKLRVERCERFVQGDENAVIARDLRDSVRSVQRWHTQGGPRALTSKGSASLPVLSDELFAVRSRSWPRGRWRTAAGSTWSGSLTDAVPSARGRGAANASASAACSPGGPDCVGGGSRPAVAGLPPSPLEVARGTGKTSPRGHAPAPGSRGLAAPYLHREGPLRFLARPLRSPALKGVTQDCVWAGQGGWRRSSGHDARARLCMWATAWTAWWRPSPCCRQSRRIL